MAASDNPSRPSPGDAPQDHGLPEVTPDLIEQEEGDTLDDIIPTRGYGPLRVVGLGGSAGGLAALQTFFGAMPPTSGMTFVVIMHLPPEHDSLLAELLQRSTSMPVRQVQIRLKIEPDHVYVIPPARHLSLTAGHLELSGMARPPARHVAVDLFFRMLADTHGPHSAAVVLSGEDGDGAIGIKRVKERGGLTVVQDPDEAEHLGMPRSSIATGLVDWVLPVADMPARLIEYWAVESRLQLPPEAERIAGPDASPPPEAEARSPVEADLHEILGFLRVRTGHDFTYYKRTTVLRRIGRRMQVNGVKEPRQYLDFLRSHPAEPDALLRDLLISVTNFFRDRDAFTALERSLPALFRGKGPEDAVRVWVAACATGEEAYSVAILLREYAGTLANPPTLQVFATDLDERAVQSSREGIYPETIAADVSTERLHRFFTREHGGYRVSREVREIVLFALHDLLKDAPFSRLDLVTCRNLLIYLNRDAQARALDIFHFALRPEGTLFLGSSESVDEGSSLFAAVDRKRRIYVRCAGARTRLPMLVDSGGLPRTMLRPPPAVGAQARARDTTGHSEASHEELRASNEELQAMNEELRSAGEELETGREELQSVNEELNAVNAELKSKVDELGHSNSDLQNLMAATQIATVFLDRRLRVQRYTPPAVALFRLIPSDVGRLLEDLAPRLDYPDLKADAERVLAELAVSEVEVAHTDGRHFLARMLPYRTVDNVIAGVVMTFVDITRRRRAEEELRASEARFRTASNVVPDVLFSTDGEGKLLWCNQRWLTYTGQTLAQAQGLGWMETLHPDDAARVRTSFQAAVARGEAFHSEHRLRGADGQARWFLVRAEPLRDADGRITQWFGAKTDIEDFKRVSTDRAASEERLRLVVENAREFAIFSTDLDLRVTSWSTGAEHILGYGEQEILGRSANVIFTPEDRAAGGPEQEAGQALAEGRAGDERWHQRKDGHRFWGSGVMMAMHGPDGQTVGFVKILRDQTEARQSREALERSREELMAALRETERARHEAEAAGRAKDRFLAILSHELRTPLVPVTLAAHMLGRSPGLPTTARESVAMIQRNVQIETHLIDDLLDITRITHGKLEIVSKPLDLHAAVRGAVEISTSDMEAKGQHFHLDLAAGEHTVLGDSNRMRQVFWNLLKNASKFTPHGGAVRLVSRHEPGRVIVEVSDTGIGFEAEATTRIFEAFTQANPEVMQTFGGLGLGLAISKATVDAHLGTLTAHSDGVGRGATFTVVLPLAGSADADA